MAANLTIDWSLVDDMILQNWTLKAIAEAIGCSVANLQRRFKETKCQTFSQYKSRTQARHASKLMKKAMEVSEKGNDFMLSKLLDKVYDPHLDEKRIDRQEKYKIRRKELKIRETEAEVKKMKYALEMKLLDSQLNGGGGDQAPILFEEATKPEGWDDELDT